MHHIVDFDPGDGAARNGTDEDAPQGVSNSDSIAPLERFNGQFSVVAFDLDQPNLRLLGLNGTLGDSGG